MRRGHPASTQATFHALLRLRIAFGCLAPPRELTHPRRVVFRRLGHGRHEVIKLCLWRQVREAGHRGQGAKERAQQRVRVGADANRCHGGGVEVTVARQRSVCLERAAVDESRELPNQVGVMLRAFLAMQLPHDHRMRARNPE